MFQDDVFFQKEADRWFQRNKTKLISGDRISLDPVLKIIELANLAPENVLEIGASNGFRLYELNKRHRCRTTAVEPSLEAIKDGKNRYPDITFLHGVANNIPIDEGVQFDLVIINFVLHWIDRSTLLRSIAEMDRLTMEGGCLLIGDFYPPRPQRVTYKHLNYGDVWTYKQDYVSILTASNLYKKIAILTYEAGTRSFKHFIEPDNCCYVSLLYKQLNSLYETKILHGE